VDARERRSDRPLVPLKPERLEVPVRRLVGALAQAQQEARLLLDLGQKRLRILRVDVGDAAAGLGQQLVPGLLDVADDPAVVAPHAGRAEQRDPLGTRHAADERLALDVADERRQEVGRLADRLHRRGDEPVIGRRVAPLVAIRVRLRNVPQGQHVVGEVVVELDQAGEHGPAGLERDDVAEPLGSRVGAPGDGGDRGAGDPDRAVRDHGRPGVHRDDPPGERPPGAVRGVDRARLVRHSAYRTEPGRLETSFSRGPGRIGPHGGGGNHASIRPRPDRRAACLAATPAPTWTRSPRRSFAGSSWRRPGIARRG